MSRCLCLSCSRNSVGWWSVPDTSCCGAGVVLTADAAAAVAERVVAVVTPVVPPLTCGVKVLTAFQQNGSVLSGSVTPTGSFISSFFMCCCSSGLCLYSFSETCSTNQRCISVKHCLALVLFVLWSLKNLTSFSVTGTTLLSILPAKSIMRFRSPHHFPRPNILLEP